MHKRNIIQGLIFLSVFFISATDLSYNVEKSENLRDSNLRKELLLRNPKIETIQEEFKNPDMIYAPFTFWFWDDEIDPKLAGEMAKEMCKQGLNPGYAHPREGLPDEEWLSPVWFEAIGNVLEESRKADCYFGYCDEYMWPSGQANGRVLKKHPELKAQSLEWQIIETSGNKKLSVPNSFFTVAAKTDLKSGLLISESLKIIGEGKRFKWTVPAGNWKIFVFNTYHHHGFGGDGVVNYLDKSLPEKFIDIAHQPYMDAFDDLAGKTLSGVFVDNEGDYGYKLAWSNDLANEYKTKKGVDIRKMMPLLIEQDVEGIWPKARWDWFDVVSDIYSKSFLGSTSNWLEERGMYDISNLWEENLFMQAFTVGDFFKAQRAVSMPGTDCLVRSILKPHDFAETHSVAEFEGKRFQSEILGIAGWETDPVLMKKAINASTTWGVNHIVPHGICLNRNMKNVRYAPDWFNSNPYWRYMHLWTDFIRRTSYINSLGYSKADVLLLNPMDSYHALLGNEIFDKTTKMEFQKVVHNGLIYVNENKNLLEEIETKYTKTINQLTENRIEFLIADKHYMQQMQLTENGILKRKQHEFKTLIVPPVYLLPLSVMKKIEQFAQNGGDVIFLGQLPIASAEKGLNDIELNKIKKKLKSIPSVTFAENDIQSLIEAGHPGLNSNIKFISGKFEMLQNHRVIDDRHFFWLANNTDSFQLAELSVNQIKGQASIWNCETGEIIPISSENTKNGSRIDLCFNPYEAFWLVIDPNKEPITGKLVQKEEKIIYTFKNQWQLSIDENIQPVPAGHNPGIPDKFLNGKTIKSELKSFVDYDLHRFSGYLDYKQTFSIEKSEGTFLLDLGNVKYMAEIWINGEKAGEKLWPPYLFDISEKIKEGENEITIRIGNLIVNNMQQLWDKKEYPTKDGAEVRDSFRAGLFGPVILKKR